MEWHLFFSSAFTSASELEINDPETIYVDTNFQKLTRTGPYGIVW
jgi:hypothetical protein